MFYSKFSKFLIFHFYNNIFNTLNSLKCTVVSVIVIIPYVGNISFFYKFLNRNFLSYDPQFNSKLDL